MPASQLITFGVGTPGDIPNYLLWGIGGAQDVEPAEGPSQYISFGIGSPASISNWLLFGLGDSLPPVDEGEPTIVEGYAAYFGVMRGSASLEGVFTGKAALSGDVFGYGSAED